MRTYRVSGRTASSSDSTAPSGAVSETGIERHWDRTHRPLTCTIILKWLKMDEHFAVIQSGFASKWETFNGSFIVFDSPCHGSQRDKPRKKHTNHIQYNKKKIYSLSFILLCSVSLWKVTFEKNFFIYRDIRDCTCITNYISIALIYLSRVKE